ncbi:MAG: WD40 repeat domain-containing protein [Planctomycetota bacterium]
MKSACQPSHRAGNRLPQVAVMIAAFGMLAAEAPAGPPNDLWCQQAAHHACVAVTYAPDGQTIASVGADEFGNHGTIKIWNALDGTLLQTIGPLPAYPYWLRYSRDGTTIVVGGSQMQYFRLYPITVWRVSDGKLVNAIHEYSAVYAGALSPDGTLLAVGLGSAYGAHPRRIRLYSFPELTFVREIKLTTSMGYAESLEFSSDGTLLVTGHAFGQPQDTKVRIWRVSDGSLVRTISGHQLTHTRGTFSPDGTMVATTSPDGYMKVWRVSDGALLHSEFRSGKHGQVVAFSPDGKWLLWEYDFYTDFFRVPNFSIGASYNLGIGAFTIEFAPDGQAWGRDTDTWGGGLCVATMPPVDILGAGGSVEISVGADVTGAERAGGLPAARAHPRFLSDPAAGAEHDGRDWLWCQSFAGYARAVSCDPDSQQLLASGRKDNAGRGLLTARFITDGTPVWGVDTVGEPFWVDWASTGDVVACGGGRYMDAFNYPLSLRSAATGAEITASLEEGPVLAGAFSPDGSILAAGVGSLTGQKVKLYQVPTLAVLREIPVESDVVSIEFSRDGTHLATGHGWGQPWDGAVRLWRVADGVQVGTLTTGSGGLALDLEFSPVGNLLAVSNAWGDGLLTLWNVQRRELVSQITRDNIGRYLGFSADGSFLTWTYWPPDQYPYYDHIRVWDGATLASLEGQLEGIKYTPDGKSLCVTAFPGSACVAMTPFPSQWVVGDLNCDGLVDFGDINPFVKALTNPASYRADYATCNILNADCNNDGLVDFGDINPFVRLLLNP